jgi:hypothetical protein
MVHLQNKSSSWYFAVFPALTGQVKPAQGNALGLWRLEFGALFSKKTTNFHQEIYAANLCKST